MCCYQENTATPLAAFDVTAIACIVAAAFAVAYAGTAALVKVAVAHAAAIVDCAVTIAYGTADANIVWYMLLHSVSVVIACAAALLV